MQTRRVVVTGLGAITPIGNTLDAYWDALLRGESGANLITHFDASKFKTQFACEVKGFDPNEFIDKKEVRKMDRFTQFAVVASDEAIKDAGLDLEHEDKDRIGVIWGAGIGGLMTFQDEVLAFGRGDGTPRFNPFFIPKMIADIAPGMISIRYGLRGPNFTTVSACASSANALIDALNYIRLGYADVMVTGGSEAAVNEAGIGGFNALHALSTRNDDYKRASRPYDVTRDGFVLGEGAGALILEEYEHAKARGAKIYCEVFGEHAYKLNLNSTKSMTGHLLGAAGAIEAIASVLAITHQVVPPTINFENPDENIDQKLNFTFNQPQKREVKVAMSNTFGFGGHNACVLFKKLD